MNLALRSNAAQEFAQPTNSTGFALISNGAQRIDNFALQVVLSVTTPAAGAFTAADTNICTKTGHGFKTGLKVQVSNSGGALPAGLSAATDYFVIVLTANTFSLATTLVLANAGTAVDITDAGTGTQTITPTSLAGASCKLQGSLDNSVWFDIGILASGDTSKTQSITAAANFMLRDYNPPYDYVRVAYTLTAGQVSIVETIETKGI